MSVPLYKPYIIRNDMDKVLTSLVDEVFETGEILKQLKKELGSFIPLKHCVARSHYGDGVSVLLEELRSGYDTIILSPLSPDVYRKAAEKLSYKILSSDTDDQGILHLDQQLCPERESGTLILIDSPFGFTPNVLKTDIQSLFPGKVSFIEDITQSFPGDNGEIKAGHTGDYVVLSLDARNIITTCGGCFLFSGNSLNSSDTLADLNASLALSQLENLEKNCQRRQSIYKSMAQALAQGAHQTLDISEDIFVVPRSFVVLAQRGINEIIRYALKQGIETERFFFQEKEEDLPDFDRFPHAGSLRQRSLKFPLYPGLRKKEIDQICRILSTLP